MTAKQFIVIAIIAIAMMMVAGCTSTPAKGTVDDASCVVSINGNTLQVQNLGSVDSTFTVSIVSYDAKGVKLNEHNYRMPSTEQGETSQRTILAPHGTASFKIDAVGTTIGDRMYRVYYLYNGGVRS